MKVWLQRVTRGAVTVAGRPPAAIGPGLVALVAVRTGDTDAEADALALKTASLRIFEDTAGKMNRSVLDTGGSVLAVPQFTLYADTSRGNRPGFSEAAPPEQAARVFDRYVTELRARLGAERVATGVFGADMQVEIHNDGPVSLELRSRGE